MLPRAGTFDRGRPWKICPTTWEERDMRTFQRLLVLGLVAWLGCAQERSSTPRTEHVEHVDETSFKAKVLDSHSPVLVDFSADWCGPCKELAPLLEEVASENPNAKFVSVNVDDSPGLASLYKVHNIPTLKLFKSGKVVAQHVGLADKRLLVSLLSQ